jgi:hypothetical protein
VKLSTRGLSAAIATAATTAGLLLVSTPASATLAKAERVSDQSSARPEISQTGYACFPQGAIVTVEVTNPTATEMSFFVTVRGVKLGIQQDQVATVPINSVESVEFHGLPSDRYRILLIDGEGLVVDRARVRVKCPVIGSGVTRA